MMDTNTLVSRHVTRLRAELEAELRDTPELTAVRAELRDALASLRATKAAHTRALQRAQIAEVELRRLNDENARLWNRSHVEAEHASESTYSASEGISAAGDDPDQFAVTDIELIRLRRFLAALAAAGGDRNAAVICKVLDGVDRLRAQAEQIAGIRTPLAPRSRRPR